MAGLDGVVAAYQAVVAAHLARARGDTSSGDRSESWSRPETSWRLGRPVPGRATAPGSPWGSDRLGASQRRLT
jgi:hypothetical protein